MASLESSLRKDLEKTVKHARRVAEAGARNAVAQLGVGEAESPKHLSAEQRALRNRLRAHGRQLGDRRDQKAGSQDTARLVQECAYEPWHRMLFARFLAENDLLIEPQSGVAITLDEVQVLAREKATDWLDLASDYAERMLPQIFRKGDPVLLIALPLETRSEMEDLLKGLSKPVFEADDSLGWVYQFWQADKKDEVNKSEAKIGADELPAVTQLFTEDYMVLFLLHNTLGAWWASKALAADSSLAASAPDEATLRAACKCKIGDFDWAYLRFVREKAEDGTEGPWRPAAGSFEGWPKVAKDITVLDPCMGSGHFLVFALPILVAFRMAEEGLSESAAVDAVLLDNLFGLEIDPRCTQIAAFNLAFAAWRKVGYHALPQLNLACSGLAIGVTKSEWLKLAERAAELADPEAKRDIFGLEKNLITTGISERAKNGLERLYELFAKAPWLGSLIEPRHARSDILNADFAQLEPLLAPILVAAGGDDFAEMAVAAQGMAKAAELLSRRYTLTATNVPYLGRPDQSEIIREYCDLVYRDARSDLAACFVQRSFSFCNPGATCALVVPQSWRFQHGYKSFRKRLLGDHTWHFVAGLGPRAFETISGEQVNVCLLALGADSPGDDSSFAGVDLSDRRGPQEKKLGLIGDDILRITAKSQLSNPDYRVTLDETSSTDLLSNHAVCIQGLATSDDPQFIRFFWEFDALRKGWEGLCGTVDQTVPYGGRERVIHWENGEGRYYRHALALKAEGRLGGWKSGTEARGKLGVLVSQMSNMPVTVYTGEFYDHSASVLVPKNENQLAAIWAYASSPEFVTEVRKLDKSLKPSNNVFVKTPFDFNKWKNVAEEQFPLGIPKPQTRDPTQWLFGGAPKNSERVLHIAVGRLSGYRWPRQRGSNFMDCSAIGADGLEKYEDGIVCLTASKGEAPAHERLTALLAEGFGAEWSAAKLANLLNEVGFAGKTLDDWLRDGFFAQHCDLFLQRPFVWQIWDGRRDGFHALVNYHRLAAPNGEGRRTLEKLIYSYLGDWIDRQRGDQKAGTEGADARLAYAEHLKGELIKILEGEPPYDIFARWKPLHEQPIGWEPDINDGVRINIRPFMIARTLNARGANACILRATPKIKWDKDRGKEPTRDKADYPWFWSKDAPPQDFGGDSEFHGNRWNDLHYSRAVKQAARDRHRLEAGAKT